MKLLIMQFSPTSRHFMSLRSKYSLRGTPEVLNPSKSLMCSQLKFKLNWISIQISKIVFLSSFRIVIKFTNIRYILPNKYQRIFWNM
jgi:hypothetical protein